ncbi:MAG TPA: 2-amino-4-hydroxy-6-hydroxymethyldihydropteridine diphosphokinase [Parvularcula sp.]|nr:2-amino-4-hydroxy-6-hydroxymethyldihydropteridine diphosphokinase [Parvularcula sp.]
MYCKYVILVGLGSSLPFCGRAPQGVIGLACLVLDEEFGLARASGFYASLAWPNPADPPFVNAAVALRAAPPPGELMAALHRIEAAFGRRRTGKNAPRTLDLDLLAYGDRVSDGAPRLPHPGLVCRDFVLAPLAEIAPEFRPPGESRTVAAILASLPAPSATRIRG